MRRLSIGVSLAVAAAAIVSPVQAQVPPAQIVPVQWPAPAYYGGTYQPYALPAPTPRDAYREGLINRWELEQLEGPTPQAMQGPSPDSSKGGQDGGGRQ